MGRIRIGIGVDEHVDNIHHVIDNSFTLAECLNCGSRVNTWKDVAKRCFGVGILYPFVHGHTGVRNSTETQTINKRNVG